MGYKPVRKLYDLEFTDYPGLAVTCTSTSLGKLMHIATLNVQLNETDNAKKMEVFNFFAKNIVKWNVVHPALDIEEKSAACSTCGLAEGAPLPSTVGGLLCLDLDFIMTIIFGWMAATSRVAAPKGLSLSNGGMPTGVMNQEELMKRLGQLQSPLISPTLS